MKNLVFNLRTAKAQAEGCAKVTKSSRMAKVLTTLTLLLTLCVGQMWGYTVYLYTGSFTDWESGADFQIWDGSSNHDMTSLGNHWYSTTLTGSPSAWIKRVKSSNHGEEWNSFSASITSSKNVWYVSGWNSGGELKYYIKHPWDGVSWTWQNMTFDSANTFKYTGIYKSGNGANVNQDKGDSNYLSPSNTSNVNDKVPAIWTYTPSSNSLRIDPAYTLTVNADSHGSASGSQPKGIKMSTKYAISASNNTGYHFSSWSRVSGGTCTFDNSSSASTNVTVTGNASATVKASFAANTYTVAYNANDDQYPGTASGSTTSSSHTYGTAKNLTSNGFSRTGYIFAGWATSPTGDVAYTNGQSVTNLSSTQGATVTLYAKWTAITLSATISPSTINANTATAIRFTITTNAPLSSGYYYEISNWGGKNSGTAGGYNIDGDRQITSASPFTYDLAAGLTNLDAGTYKIKLKITKNAVTQVESDLLTLTVSSSTYTVTVNAGTGGTVSPASISASPDSWSGDITAAPNAGYRFVNWTSSGGGITIKGNTSNPTQVKATSTGGTLTANFAAATYRVTLNNQSATTAGTAYVDATYNTTTLTSINKPAKTNYTFGGYYTATGGGGTQIIDANGNWLASKSGFTDGSKKSIITENKILYAKWTETKYAVTVAVDDASHASGDIACTAAGWVAGKSGTAQIGNLTNVTITVGAAAAGYKFDGGYWTLTGGVTLIDGSLTSPSIIVKATATGSATYTYAEDLTTNWYINGDAPGTMAGSPFAGWGTSGTRMSKKPGHSTEEIYYCDITVSTVASTDDHYPCKVYNGNNGHYYSSNDEGNYWITKENNSVTVYDNTGNNMKFRPYLTGTYQFKVDNTGTNPVLTVTWPIFNQVRISVASPADATNVGNFDLSAPVSNVRTVTRSLAANTTYTFKIMYNSEWYGYNSGTFTRSNSTSSNSRTLSTSGGNLTLTTDYAGDYTFKFNESTKVLSIDFPEAYKITYGKGTVDGSSSSCSAKDIDNSNAAVTSNSTWVKSGNRVVLTAPVAKTGYTYNGWFDNNSGTGAAITTSANCTITVTSALTRYACYTQDDYTITLNGNGGTGHTASVTAHYGEFAPVDDGVGGHKFSITNPNHDGYTFAGWYTNSDGTGTMLINPDGYLTWSIDGFTDGTGKWIATSGTNLYARWKTNASVGKYNFQYGSGTWYSSSWTLMNFGDADDHERTIDFTLIDPTSKKFFVGYDGDFQSVRIGEEGTAGASSEENLSNLRLAPGTLSVGSAIGATGKLVIFDNSSEENLYVGFKPNGYGLTYAGGTKAFSEVSDHLWQTDIVTLTSSDVAGSFKVGLLTATPGSYVDCSTMTATDNAAALNTRKNALVTEQSYPAIPNLAAGQEGRFVIWDNDSHAGQQWYLCFLPVYSITYNDNGASSGSVPVDANKYRTNETPTVLGNSGSLAKTGYAFSGWNTAPDGSGTAYTVGSNLEAIGDNVILYAQYRKAEITDVVLNAGIFEPVAAGDPATYVTADPTLDPTPAPIIKLCWELRYSNDNPVTGHDPISVSGNQVKFLLNGLAAGGYKIHVELRTGSTCGAGELLSSFDKSFSIASDHIVTVQYKCGDFTLKAPTNVGGKPLDWSEEITADAIDGYAFSSWTAGDGVTIKDSEGEDKTTSTEATIKIKANYDGTLTANYTKKRMIYFNNTLGWESVYVYFYRNDKYWGYGSDDGKGTGSSTSWTKDATYPFIKSGAMTQIDGTDIWFYDCEANSVAEDVENIVFTEYHQENYTYFSYKYETTTKNNVIRRGDYKTSLPMFVPLTGVDPVEMNNKQANYYNEGYWMNYPENTGYTLKIYNSKTYGTADELQSIPFEFTADKTLPMSLTVELNANKEYGFEIHRADGTTYGNNTKVMKINDSGDNADAWAITSDKRTGVKTSVAGDYIFTLNFGNNGGYNYLVGVHYPVAEGDYRILYQDLTTWSQSSAHTSSWSHPSRAIHKEDGAEDIVSFYVSKATGANATMKFQYASAVSVEGVVTWMDVTSGSIDLSDIENSGVYNFYLTQSAGAISVDKIEAYTGKFYIRTDCAGSTKWENYRASDHEMPYTEFSMSDANSFGEKYSHYYTHWCPGGTNIKFVVANEYSSCISDTLESDLHDWGNLNDGGWLKHQDGKSETEDIYSANVRFMYNQETNKISRAYVASSTNASRLFLVLRGNEVIKDENGTPVSDQGVTNGAILSDKENWIYERILQIKPNSRFKLFACYAEASPTQAGAQYFRGAYDSDNFTTNDNSVILISGSGSYQKARILYDFKTNRLVCAWLPSDEPIDETLDIDADVMVIRDHQEAAECITFSGSGELTDVKTVYGAMKFNRWTLNNRYRGKGGVEDNNKDHCDSPEDIAEYHGILPAGEQKSVYERSLYFISFPFDVKVSEIFGFGTYGKHWVLEYYDGLNRAKNGYWIDSPANWKYVTPSMAKTYELKAYEGYILCLSLGRMAYDNTEFWANNISNVELYFPSKTPMTNIQTTDVNISGLNEIAGDPYRCTINREGEDGDRRVKDSYWRCLGVPSYNLYAGQLKEGEGGSTITWQTNYNTFPFLYAWNMTDNTLTPQATNAFSFKPMHAYLTQIGTAIYWTNVSATPASVIARQVEEPAEYNWRLTLNNGEDLIDQTYVRMSTDEVITNEFDFGQDLSKELNTGRSDIYSFIGNERAAANSLQMNTETTTVVRLGLNIEATGDYTFSIPDGTNGIGITLIDEETGIRTSLSALDYTVELAAGDYTERFWLEISPVKGAETGIDPGVDARENGVRKVMIDGILYIVRDGKMYDATGKRVE